MEQCGDAVRGAVCAGEGTLADCSLLIGIESKCHVPLVLSQSSRCVVRWLEGRRGRDSFLMVARSACAPQWRGRDTRSHYSEGRFRTRRLPERRGSSARTTPE